MADLFSYIEHAFAVPARTAAIDVANDSPFQQELREAAAGENAYATVREKAVAFLSEAFDPTCEPVHHSAQLRDFKAAAIALPSVNTGTLGQLVDAIFDMPVHRLVESDTFRADKQLLENGIVAVKIATGFNSVDAAALMRSIQAVELIENLAQAGSAYFTREHVESLLARPVRVPSELLVAPPAPEPAPAPGSGPSLAAQGGGLAELRARRDRLRDTYESLMALPPQQLELVPSGAGETGDDTSRLSLTAGNLPAGTVFDAVPARLRLASAARRALAPDQLAVLEELPMDAAEAPYEQVVSSVKQQLIQADRELLPALTPGPARVYRLGANVFAVGADTVDDNGGAAPVVADFSHAVARPVGVGNLQVVRQELIGYRPGEVSHIENVLEGEVLKRSTRREESTETMLTDETSSTQSQERDLQSTSRNELASETQKEASQQTTTNSELTSSASYGRLVENSKSAYAQSVTSRAVDAVTTSVRQQRVQRERRTYTEEALHELDNAKGTKKIRGVYQWVDKKYSVRVLNYGKRLLYDVVVPEPASFLIQSLRDGVQSETLQLNKPTDPRLNPRDLNASNYGYYASLYGVTGSVSPPPEEFTRTVAQVGAKDVSKELKAFGGEFHGQHYDAFIIKVPENYRAISGYIQQVNQHYALPAPGRYLEFFIGQNNYFRFGPNDITTLNVSFTMGGETGDIPVTLKSVDTVIQFNYAIGINCRRTDQAYEQWQLKTHAAIMSGYQRQLADYQDKLGRYTAMVRSQMAMAASYGHDPKIEREELKKAFIYLLLGEHPGTLLPTPTPAPVPPLAQPPDPVAVKRWGAMVGFFERAFEWENLMYSFYPYFWGRVHRWSEMILTQDTNPLFEAFLKAGAARVVVPVRPGFEAALAHYHETGDVWMGEEIPDMFSDFYVSIIAEIKAAHRAPGDEVCVDQWEVTLPTTLVMLKQDEELPSWTPTPCDQRPEA